jgi:uncharacterized flavoprotein (TIGR03862 family)
MRFFARSRSVFAFHSPKPRRTHAIERRSRKRLLTRNMVNSGIPITDAPFCAVVGAGPAGLIAAGALAQAGARVTIYEAKPSPARKFLMAGRGGLNLTHSEPLDVFLTRYGAAAPRLAPHIRAFPPQRLRDCSAELGEETFVGSSGRVFPKSFKASPLLRALLKRLAGEGVRIETRVYFEGFVSERDLLLRNANGARSIVAADAVVLALGGASWPRLGSDGAWIGALAARGVAVAPLAPANCGLLIDWSERFRNEFEGQPLKTIALGHDSASVRGDVVITRSGLEGGPAYALSSGVRRAIAQTGSATLHVDLRPHSAPATLAQKLSRPREKQSLSSLLRKAAGLSKLEIALLREVRRGDLADEPESLASLIKQVPLAAQGTAGLERAISSSGGIAFDEIDDELMLKKMPGVFVAGEMLDFDAPTGGYLLQAAFATGYAAGISAAHYVGLAP